MSIAALHIFDKKIANELYGTSAYLRLACGFYARCMMVFIMFSGSAVSFLLAALLFIGSQTSIHEIEALVLFQVSAVLF